MKRTCTAFVLMVGHVAAAESYLPEVEVPLPLPHSVARLEEQSSYLVEGEVSLRIDVQDPVPFSGGWVEATVTVHNRGELGRWVPEVGSSQAHACVHTGGGACDSALSLSGTWGVLYSRENQELVRYPLVAVESAERSRFVAGGDEIVFAVRAFNPDVCKPGRFLQLQVTGLDPWLPNAEINLSCPPEEAAQPTAEAAATTSGLR